MSWSYNPINGVYNLVSYLWSTPAPLSQEAEWARKILLKEMALTGKFPRESDFEFVSQENAYWEDTSMGCPKPANYYSSTGIRGFVITFKYEGQLYRIHADEHMQFFASPDLPL